MHLTRTTADAPADDQLGWRGSRPRPACANGIERAATALVLGALVIAVAGCERTTDDGAPKRHPASAEVPDGRCPSTSEVSDIVGVEMHRRNDLADVPRKQGGCTFANATIEDEHAGRDVFEGPLHVVSANPLPDVVSLVELRAVAEQRQADTGKTLTDASPDFGAHAFQQYLGPGESSHYASCTITWTGYTVAVYESSDDIPDPDLTEAGLCARAETVARHY